VPTPQQSVADKIEKRRSPAKRLIPRPDGSAYSKDPKIRHDQLIEDGKIGGKGSELARQNGAKGGRPRKITAQELVAERARDEAEEIWSGLRAGLSSDSAKQRRESALAILAIEEKHLKRQEREEDRKRGMDKDQIIAMLVEKIMGGGAAATAIKSRLGEVIEGYGTVVDDGPAALPSRGED
jgi:hypothetical protein